MSVTTILCCVTSRKNGSLIRHKHIFVPEMERAEENYEHLQSSRLHAVLVARCHSRLTAQRRARTVQTGKLCCERPRLCDVALGWSVNNDLEGMWKEAGVLFGHLLGWLRLVARGNVTVWVRGTGILYVLLTVLRNIMIVLFFTNMMQKFFILIHLLHSTTCFEHCCAHPQEDNCINTASGTVTLFGWLFRTQVTRGLLLYWCRLVLVTCVLNSHPKRVTIPDAVLIQLSSWRWAQKCSTHVEECNKCIQIKNLCIILVKKLSLKWELSAA